MDTCALLLHYNNYFNRTIKRLETKNEYQAADSAYGLCNHINFNPGDGITTSHVFGFGANQTSLFDGEEYDYLIIYDGSDSDNNYPIVSRWFIIETRRTRDGQYELILRRDVIADNLDEILTAPTYIEKGLVNAGSPLIFNKEGMLFNQIKKKEETLKDGSGSAWLVAYISKDASATNVTINYDPAKQNYEDVSASDISDWFTSFGISPGQVFLADPYDISYRTAWQAGPDFIYNYACRTYIYGTGSYGSENDNRLVGNDALRCSWNAKKADIGQKILNAYNTYGLATFKNALINLVGAHNATEVTRIKGYNGKIIKTQDGKYYRITVKAAPNTYSVKNVSLTSGSDLYNLMTAAAQTSGAFVSGHTTPDNSSFKYSFTCSQYIVTYQEDHTYEVKSNISINRNKTKDAIYDIIALPYPDSGESINIHNSSRSISFNVTQPVSMSSITSIATALGGGGAASKIYDIQLLPYCPVQTAIDTAIGGMIVDESKAGTEFEWIIDNSNNNKIGILFYVTQSAFTFDIDKQLYWNQYRIIEDFNDIDILPLPYTSLKQGMEYVIPELEKPDTLPWDNDGTVSTRIQTLSVNAITCNKINKITGEIVDSVNVNAINITFYRNSSTFGGAYLDLGIYVSSGTYTPTGWSWSKTEYNEDDVYLSFALNNDSWGGRYVNEGIGHLAKIPVYNNEISGAYAMKIDNECNSYRLVSPNYQGEFEFSPVKNGGVDRFNVDCTYKPYNPYIHVNPDFGGLYGDDFNDSRGLICQGDFTVGMISDAFTNYELQNKNYQQIFNRQIQNMDVSNEIARQEQGFKSISGTITGGLTGGVAGGMAGGVYGAIAGAAVGTVTGAVGGIADYYNLDKQLKENKNYAVDMYNFNLQNIKALPYTMTRCTALTYNNKLFPFIESYSCTDEEKAAFIGKLTYDGMTVNVVGEIQDYTDMEGRMIKGQVIRLPNNNKDSHMAKEIYDELLKGVYI